MSLRTKLLRGGEKFQAKILCNVIDGAIKHSLNKKVKKRREKLSKSIWEVMQNFGITDDERDLTLVDLQKMTLVQLRKEAEAIKKTIKKEYGLK